MEAKKSAREPFRLPYIENRPLKLLYSILWGLAAVVVFTGYPLPPSDIPFALFLKTPVPYFFFFISMVLAWLRYSEKPKEGAGVEDIR